MTPRLVIPLVILLVSTHSCYCQCETPPSLFPGYHERFTGTILEGTDYTFMEYEIKLKQVFSEAATFELYRNGVEYERFSLTVGKYHKAKDNDVLVTLNSVSGNQANITLYTQDIAILNANISIVPDVNYSSLINSSFTAVRSGAHMDVDVVLNNTGELPAQNITIEPLLKDFEIISGSSKNITQLCPGSTALISLRLKAPLLWEITNYTLPFRVTYSYFNPQTGKTARVTDLFTANLTVVGESRIAIYKKVRYPYDFEKMQTRDYALVGERITITVEIKNTGKVFDFIGSVREILPSGLEVVEGRTEWNGRISPGESAYLSYVVTSKTPAEYTTYSLVEYRDEHGIVFSRNRSKEVVVKFLELKPEVVVEHRAEETFLNRVTLEMNTSTNLSIVVENRGSAPALDISIKPETQLITDAKLVGIDLLKPGEIKTYTFQITGNRQGKHEFKTEVSYRDEFRRSYTASNTTYIYVEAPLLLVEADHSLQDSRLKLDIKVKNSGTMKAENTLLRVEHPPEFKLISGQSVLPVGTLESEKTKEFNLEFLVPIPEEEKKFEFRFDVEYTDRLNTYKDTFSKHITLKPPSGELGVAVTGKNLYALREKGLVEIFIKNSRSEPERCVVRVEIPENFKVASDYRLKDREIYLKPGESFRYKFGVVAIAPGEGEIKAHVRYSQGEVIKSLQLRVKEPYLRVNTAELSTKSGEEQSVEITIENTGYAEATQGWLYFNPPEEIILDKTELPLPELPPGGKATLRLKIRTTKADEFELPYILKWRNSEEFEASGSIRVLAEVESEIAKTEKPAIEKQKKPVVESKKTEIAERKESRSYAVIALILLLALVVGVVFKLRRGAGVEF